MYQQDKFKTGYEKTDGHSEERSAIEIIRIQNCKKMLIYINLF